MGSIFRDGSWPQFFLRQPFLRLWKTGHGLKVHKDTFYVSCSARVFGQQFFGLQTAATVKTRAAAECRASLRRSAMKLRGFGREDDFRAPVGGEPEFILGKAGGFH